MTTQLLGEPPTPTDIAWMLVHQYRRLAKVVAELSDEQWDAETRCAPWRVRHVAARAAGLAEDALTGEPFRRSPDEQAHALDDDGPTELAQRIRQHANAFERRLSGALAEAWDRETTPGMTLRQGILALAYDTYVYTDDILNATGGGDPGPAAEAAVWRLATVLADREWGPAILAFDGMPVISLGSRYPGNLVTGDPHRFVLAAAGRIAATAAGLAEDVNVYR